jgi:hypothetical protein
MPSKTKRTESQPFLEPYSDNPATNDPESDRKFRPIEGRKNRLLSHSLVFVVTSLLWMLVIFGMSEFPTWTWSNWRTSISEVDNRHNVTSNAKLVKCGSTTQEARALGCKYDILLNNWVPSACIDRDEFVEEYLDDGSWAAFADEKMTQKLTTVDEMSEREFYYTSVRDHINHCAVMWKKQFWALYEERQAFDTVIASPGHTDHCAQYLMDAGEGNWTVATRVERGFAGCWIRQ